MLTALTALVAGTVHVLSGPDHMAAIAPLAIADGRRGWFAGWTWGLGHASGVAAVAVLAVLLRDLLPPVPVISAWSERLVGAALMGVGLWALRSSLRIGDAPHAHGTVVHAHMHVQRGPAFARRLGHAHAAFLMGILHGLAGSSHFLGVLPALALPTRAAAFTYVAVYGVSSVMAMTAFAAVVGVAADARSPRGGQLHRAMMFAGSVLALAVGGYWLAG